MAQQDALTGQVGREASLETRLHHARLKRQKILSAKNSAPLGPAEGDRPLPTPVAEPEVEGARADDSPPSRMQLPANLPRNAILGFSVSAGVGFGVVLAIGILGGIDSLPVGTAPIGTVPAAAPDVTADEPDARAVASVEEIEMPISMQAPVSSAVLPGSEAVTDEAVTDAETRDGPFIHAVTPELSALSDGNGESVGLSVPVPDRFAEDGWSGSKPPPALASPEEALPPAEEMTLRGPSEPGIEFFMHVPNGVSRAKLQAVVSTLDQSGVKISEIGREPFRVSTTHLRFYSPETADRAREVAATLGVEARDFSQNFSDDRRIEIWVAGRPGSRSSGNGGGQRRFNSYTRSYDGR